MAINDVSDILDEALKRGGDDFAEAVYRLVAPIAEIDDARVLAREATRMLSALSMAEIALAKLRDIAVHELIDTHEMNYRQVAQVTGLSKGRIGQMRRR